MFNSKGHRLFPFYWTQDPRLIKGVDGTLLTPYESEIISFLNTFQLFEIKELLALETDHPSLILYLRKYFLPNLLILIANTNDASPMCLMCGLDSFLSERMRTVSPEEWAAILAKAKQKKAQEEGADPNAALVVQDIASCKGVKRHRKMGITRPAKILKAGPVPATSPVKQDQVTNVIQVASDEVHSVDPPSPPPTTEKGA
jgi:hypothetical protein